MGHPIRRMVLDLSHHNTVTDWNAVVDAGIYGIIHKATEGDYMDDDTYASRRKAATNAGLLWGAYHFGTNSPVEEQVDLFLRHADPDVGTLVCLDWEPYGAKQMSKAQAREWIELVEGTLGRPGSVVIYSGNLAKEQLSSSDVFFGERRLWLAHYSSTPKVEPPWEKFWLWQYSDGAAGPGPHGCPGCSGHVDTNSYDKSAADLVVEWADGSTTEPSDELVVRIIVSAPPGVKVVVENE